MQKNTLLGLMAQTSIHAGTDQNIGIIDRPIQREGHNGWPCVFGSAVKGAIRVVAEENTIEQVAKIFGSETNVDNPHGGAVSFSDARIVLFPVRSLTSQFKWITCPAALKRLTKDMKRFEQTYDEIETLEEIKKGNAISPQEIRSEVFLEEYCFSTEQKPLDKTIKLLVKLVDDKDFAENLNKQLLILSDDDFSYLVSNATPVNAHIAIERETKTVIGGALWYEETLPPETLLYITLSAFNARDESNTSAKDMLESITKLFVTKPWLQMGGNETVGMGWCAVKNIQEG